MTAAVISPCRHRRSWRLFLQFRKAAGCIGLFSTSRGLGSSSPGGLRRVGL